MKLKELFNKPKEKINGWYTAASILSIIELFIYNENRIKYHQDFISSNAIWWGEVTGAVLFPAVLYLIGYTKTKKHDIWAAILLFIVVLIYVIVPLLFY